MQPSFFKYASEASYHIPIFGPFLLGYVLRHDVRAWRTRGPRWGGRDSEEGSRSLTSVCRLQQFAITRNHGPDVAGCPLLCNEGNPLQHREHGLKVLHKSESH
ncbi:hypothetical protein PBY51_000788 [Eleginops maclovinus]|uniref:Uncharacterized protein n=1 Tax=Eleginops maclovinus TaxID=56733 RepID=A0AAN8AQX9_ELEMC|nr:hypothetical protein PBY51_000788 [Eleginops maclovinus]